MLGEVRSGLLLSALVLTFFFPVEESHGAACGGLGSLTCDDGSSCVSASDCPGDVNCVSDCFAGTGSASTECLVNLLGARLNYPSDAGPADPAPRRTEIRCTDGDDCDADGTVNNRCGIELRTCLDSIDESGSCPSNLTITDVSVKNRSGAKANASLTALQDAARQLLPAAGPVCSDPVTVEVPVKATRCERFKAATANVAISATAGSEALVDKDKLKLRCMPAISAACATIHGHVFGPRQLPLAGAVVTSGAVSVETDVDGSFSVAVAQTGRVVLRVSRQDYVSTVKAVETTAGEEAITEISLLSLPAALPVEAGSGGTAVAPSGTTVTFPEDAFVDAHGQPLAAAALVDVTVVPIDPSTDAILAFPGSFDAIGAGGEPEVLQTITLVDISLTLDGAPVQLAPGKTALLELVIPSSASNPITQAPFALNDVVPTYWLNPATAIWEREGSGTVVTCTNAPEPLCVQAEVEHFTWWNVDMPMQTTCVRGVVVDTNGLPAGGVFVETTGIDFESPNGVTATAAGAYCAHTRVDSSVQLSAFKWTDGLRYTAAPEMVSTSATPGNCSMPATCTIVPDLVIPDSQTCVRGRVVTSQGAPLAGATVHGSNMEQAVTSADGTFCSTAAADAQVPLKAEKGTLVGSSTVSTAPPGGSCQNAPACVDVGDVALSIDGCPDPLTGSWLFSGPSNFHINIVENDDGISAAFTHVPPAAFNPSFPAAVLPVTRENGMIDVAGFFTGRQLDCSTVLFTDGVEGHWTMTRVGFEACGDQVVSGTEQCDDGNTGYADGCAFLLCFAEFYSTDTIPAWNCDFCTSRAPGCGNGTLDAGEQCDDTNPAGFDRCLPDCTLPVCGNGQYDRCEGAVTIEQCTNIEQCDDGAGNSDVLPGACRTNCLRAHCGDGVVDAGEQCDDGGNGPGDGCDASCQDE